MIEVCSSTFFGFGVNDNSLSVAISNRSECTVEQVNIADVDELDQFIYDFIESYQKKHKVKCIAAGIGEASDPKKLGEKLWLEQDVVPIIERGVGSEPSERAQRLAQQIESYFKHDQCLDVVQVHADANRKIAPAFLTTLAPYEKVTAPEEYKFLLHEAQRFKNNKGKLLFINSTPQGGGVALMRHAVVRLYELLGLDVAWHVLIPKAEVFEITKKKFHNLLQGVAEQDVILSPENKQTYKDWIAENAEILKAPLQEANVIIIDDWQPSGLIEFIKENNPDCRIMFRSHIHVDTSLFTEGSPQKVTWDFVWKENGIEKADLFISHPIEEFVPDVVPQEKIVLKPATTDPIDGLNKHLSQSQLEYYLACLNNILLEDKQVPLDYSRPYITQVARFDPSKGIPEVLESYRLLRKKCEEEELPLEKVPQLVIGGHGAIDDPEGVVLLEEAKAAIKTGALQAYGDDIKFVRLVHNDQILNAIMQGALFALQLSCKEGCEVKVSEALYKGKPIIIFNTGGMPLQIENGENAFAIEQGRVDEVAAQMYRLLTDKELYNEMSTNAIDKVKSEFFTVSGASHWLFLANELLEKKKLMGNCRTVTELIKQATLN